MTIAWGVGESATSGTTASTLATPCPLANAAVAGTFFYIAGVCSANATAPTCSDTKGNVYTLARTLPFSGSTLSVCAFYSVLTATLVTGTDTITINFGVSSNSRVTLSVIATDVNTLDANPAGSTGNSTTPSLSSGTLVSANEFLVGVVGQGLDAASFTITGDAANGWDPSYMANGTSGATPDVCLVFQLQIVSATTAKTFAPTLTTSQWGELVHSFMVGVGSIALAGNQRLILM